MEKGLVRSGVSYSGFSMNAFSAMLLCLCVALLSACSDDTGPTDDMTQTLAPLTVYKTASCGCCNDWVSHVLDYGFKVDVVEQDSIAHIKDLYKIPLNLRSCHTAVSDDGLVFEGHVPAKYMAKFLQDRPSGATGLSVPSMPVGSPGMEQGDTFHPYRIFQLQQDGSFLAYTSVENYQQQFNQSATHSSLER